MINKIYKKTVPIDITSDDRKAFDTSQLAKFTIFNNTQYNFTLKGISLEWGTWENVPKNTISKNSTGFFSARGTLFGGIEGNVEYVFPDGGFNIYWTISTWGEGHAELTKSNPKGLYDMNIANAGLYTFVVNIGEKEPF